MSTANTTVSSPLSVVSSNPRAERCCTCGRPRGLVPRRESWGICTTVLVPRTEDPNDKPWQITNDLIHSAGVWCNGGSNESTHICDECVRIGLRSIKLKVDELLGVIEAGKDKDAEIAQLTQRLAKQQFNYQNAVNDHNRMQARLAQVLKLFGSERDDEAIELKHARWEVKQGHQSVTY